MYGGRSWINISANMCCFSFLVLVVALASVVALLLFQVLLFTMALPLPDWMKQQLELQRPACRRWNLPAGCKHNDNCKFRHDTDSQPDRRDRQAANLPHCARHTTADGQVYIVARPPIEDGLKFYWSGIRNCFFSIPTGMLMLMSMLTLYFA